MSLSVYPPQSTLKYLSKNRLWTRGLSNHGYIPFIRYQGLSGRFYVIYSPAMCRFTQGSHKKVLFIGPTTQLTGHRFFFPSVPINVNVNEWSSLPPSQWSDHKIKNFPKLLIFLYVQPSSHYNKRVLKYLTLIVLIGCCCRPRRLPTSATASRQSSSSGTSSKESRQKTLLLFHCSRGVYKISARGGGYFICSLFFLCYPLP